MTLSAQQARDIASVFESRWVQGYVRGKLARDSIYVAVADALRGSRLPVLDVGCGLGLLSHYLNADGIRLESYGIDHDIRKVSAAHEAAVRRGLTSHFAVADARSTLRFKGNVLLLDLLHYFREEDQRSILRSAADATAPDGQLIIRDCLRDETWRYRVTALQERFSKMIGWLRGEVLNFPPRELIERELVAAGLVPIDVRPLWANTPFNNYLLRFRRS